MAKPYDTTLKHLVEAYPRDWLRFVGIPFATKVELVDADLATVTAEADKLFLVKSVESWLLNLELQASYRTDLPDRLFFGGALAGRRHLLPVQSVAILLRPEADGPAMSGRLVRRHPPEREYLDFRYDVVRLWQIPVEAILTGGLGVLPLAPLALGAETQLDRIVNQMQEQLATLPDTEEKGSLLAASFVLMGLRYSQETAEGLFRGVHNMEESVTYQAIIAKGFSLGLTKGHLETAKQLLIKVGTKRFGAPPLSVLKAINAIVDYDKLERLNESLVEISGWDQLPTN